MKVNSLLRLLAVCAIAGIGGLCGAVTSASLEERVEKLLSQMTVEEKIDYIGGDRDFYIRAVPRLGIPEIKMSDGPVGVRNYGKTTQYPAGICLAATWNPDLATAYGTAIAHDARARGVHIWLAPGLNIYRAPMCGRNFEYFGEDPFLASRIAVALVKQTQAEGVLPTIKHYACNNQEYERNQVSSNVDERTLHEIYLQAFRTAVQEGGAQCIMDAYNLINGTWCTANKFINTDFMKNECGFDGLIMSDWGAVHDTLGAANGGMDLEMPSGKYLNRETLLPLLKSGQVTQATMDDKVRRILRVIVRAGFLDREQKQEHPLDDPANAATALQIAREGIVLLKNDNDLLPLKADALKSIAVIGPLAADGVPAGGGSSRTQPFHEVSFLEGIRAQSGAAKVSFASGLTTDIMALCGTCKFEHDVSGKSESGLLGEYYPNRQFKNKPVLSQTDQHINFDWGTSSPMGLPADNFSVRWTGSITPTASGAYTLAGQSDDGIRVILDGKPLVEEWNDHRLKMIKVTRNLEAGRKYALKVEYYEKKGEASVQFGWWPAVDPLTSDAVELARHSDAAVVCVGLGDRIEFEGADRPFELPDGQDDLIRRVAEANPHTVVVVAAGGNVDMQPWLGKVPGVVQAWYPGQEGGAALGEILFGKVSPSGKLPATFEKRWADNPCHDSYYAPDKKSVQYKEGVFIGYRGYDQNKVEAQFCFGHGLSYSTFDYREVAVTPATVTSGSKTTVSFKVVNTGEMEAAEVAQVYVHPMHSKIPRPPKELKGFRKVTLEPGEGKQVEVELGSDAFSYWNPDSKAWTADAGEYELLIGASSRDIRLKSKITLTGGN